MSRRLLVRFALALSLASLAVPGTAVAQNGLPFDASIHVVSARIGELDANDVGISGRLGWRVSPLFGVEGEVGFYPSDLGEPSALTSNRTELLVGVTFGPQLGRIRPFVRARPGLLKLAEAPQPVACILIYPPPLSCTLAGGQTLFVADIGGGVDVNVTGGTFFRIDVGDRLTRYPGPAFSRDRTVYDESFTTHDLRVAVGAGWRF